MVIEFSEFVEHISSGCIICTLWIAEVKNRVMPGRKLNALVHGIQKTIRPQFGVYPLAIPISFGNQNAKGRQVFIFTTQSITEPRPHARAVPLLGTGLKKCDGRVVVDRFGVQASNNTQ